MSIIFSQINIIRQFFTNNVFYLCELFRKGNNILTIYISIWYFQNIAFLIYKSILKYELFLLTVKLIVEMR